MKTEKHTSRKPLPSLTGGVWGWVFGLLLTSCTLSMEEWTVPEEEKGFEEAETVKYEHGTFTYQFKEGVRSITDNIQEYILRYECQGDNRILYFMDNTPENWLPKTGDLVSAMCTPTLPFGLNHRVTSVKNIGGMYQVECEPASRDEIYEDLVFEFDGDYQIPGIAAFDSLTLDSLGIDPNDLILEDLSLLEEHYGEQAMTRAGIHSTLRWRETPALQKLREAGLVSITETRADDDQPKQTEDEKTKSMNFNLDKLSLKFSFGKGFFLRIGGNYKKTDLEHVWFYEDKKNDYRKQVTTSTCTSTFDIDVHIGKEGDPEKKKKPKDMTVKELEDVKKMLKDIADKFKKLKDNKEKTKQEFPLSFTNIHLPIGATGFFIVIKFEGGVDFEGGLTGHFKCTNHDPVLETTYIYDKGKETYIPDPAHNKDEAKGIKEEGYTTIDDLSFAGELNLEIWVRAAVGVELGTHIGLGCDVGLKGIGGATLKLDLAHYQKDKTVLMPNEASVFRIYLAGEAAATAYWSPMGKNLFEAKWTFWHPYEWLINEWLTPHVDKDDTHSSVEDIGDGKRKFHMDYSFDCIWSDWLLTKPKPTLIPRLRVYHGSYKDPFKDMKLDDDMETTELKRFSNYKFDFTDDDLLGQAAQYICVPCIYNFDTDQTYEFRDAAKTFGSTGANLTFIKFKQKYGLKVKQYLSQMTKDMNTQEEVDNYENQFLNTFNLNKKTDYLMDWKYYEFGATYDAKNLTMYREWGMKVTLSLQKNGKDPIYEKDLKAQIINNDWTDITMRNGKKTMVFQFVTKTVNTLYVTLTPYVISAKGKRTDFPSVGPYFLDDAFYMKSFDWGSDIGFAFL